MNGLNLVGLVGVVRRAQRTDSISSGYLPFAAPSNLFFSASRILPFVRLAAPFDCRCATDANLISRLSPSHIYLNLSESNCLPLLVMNSFGTPKRQTMFFHTNFCTAAEVIAPRGSASIHREKYSTATIANLCPVRAAGNGPIMSSPHLANGLQVIVGRSLASTVTLAAFAFLNLLSTDFQHSWPVNPLSKYFGGHRSCGLVRTT